MAVIAVSNIATGAAGLAHPSMLVLAGLLLPWPCAAASMRFARHA